MTDPTTLGDYKEIEMPEKFLICDNLIVPPASEEEAESIEILRGPNIKPFPVTTALPESILAKTVLKVEDNITTDHIMPAGAKILPYRSNIPYLSQFCFKQCDENFAENCKKAGSGVIIGGANYGQGSSREHAALVPLYLGIKAVITKSFARIHVANLINAGIIPLTFVNEADYDSICKDDELSFEGIAAAIKNGETEFNVKNVTKNSEFKVNLDFSKRQRDMLLAGGLLNYTKENA